MIQAFRLSSRFLCVWLVLKGLISSEIPSFRVIPIGAGLTEPSAFRVVTMVSTVLPVLKPSFSRSPDILVDDMERIYPGDS